MDQALPLQRLTVVFDLDGTIADTASDLVIAANMALAASGFPEAGAEAIRKGVGYGTKAMLRSGLGSLGIEPDAVTLNRLAADLVSYYEDHIADHTQTFPGFVEAATELRRLGATLAVCTNKKEHLAKKLLEALALTSVFNGIAGGDTFPFCKPDPRHIIETVRQAGGDPRYAIMIGDSEADIKAAKAAGLPSIAVSFGYSATPFERLGADATIQRFDDLPFLITSVVASTLLI